MRMLIDVIRQVHKVTLFKKCRLGKQCNLSIALVDTASRTALCSYEPVFGAHGNFVYKMPELNFAAGQFQERGARLGRFVAD